MNRWTWPVVLALALGAFATFGVAPAEESTEKTKESAAKNPHGKFDEECSLCHTADAWVPARVSKKFDHAKYGLPLEGAHKHTPCRSCHTSLDFTKAETPCAECHQDVHAGELGVDCASCHTTRSFIDRSRMERAHRLTRFPLNGTHATLDCEVCHAGAEPGHMTFVNVSTECVSCHRAEYDAAVPDHRGNGFSENCVLCHGDRGWGTADFDHAGFGFPLTGAHAALECARCHTGGSFAGLSPACVSCHQADYDGTTDPNHAQLQFPTDCASCHGTSTWNGASFDHASTGFPLTGAHTALQCMQCHVPGASTPLPTACAGCHQADYDGTTDPNHAQIQFPTDCTSCHTTTTWIGAKFDHDAPYFPIYSGTHAGRWNACADCHANPGNYAEFDCLGCHPHDNKTETDGHHQGMQNYLYESQACYGCHPRGRAG
jgi:hypothetical protein